MVGVTPFITTTTTTSTTTTTKTTTTSTKKATAAISWPLREEEMAMVVSLRTPSHHQH